MAEASAVLTNDQASVAGRYERRWLGPLAVGFSTATTAAVVSLFNPTERHIPLCGLKALLGLDCPFCGSLRSTYELTHGNIGAAFNQNLLFTLLVPIAVLAWGVWLYKTVTVKGWRPKPSTRTQIYLFAGLLGVFAVARNLPGFHWLASGT